MITITRKELIGMGGVVIANTGILDGEIFHHHSNDYQAGAGNHRDYQLFVSIIDTNEREPVLGGVNYYFNGNLVIKKEYPLTMTESGADRALKKGGLFAEGKRVYIYTNDFLA